MCFFTYFMGRVEYTESTEIEAQAWSGLSIHGGLLGPSGPSGNAETLKGCLMPKRQAISVGTTPPGKGGERCQH